MIYHVAYQPIGTKDIRGRRALPYSDDVNYIAHTGRTLKAMAARILELQNKCERIVVIESENMGYSMKNKIWEWRRKEED
jgi:hypothetical protein